MNKHPQMIARKLKPLVDRIHQADRHTRLGRMPPAAESALAHALFRHGEAAVLLICDSPHRLDALHQDLVTLAGDDAQHLLYYPAWESLPDAQTRPNHDITGLRLQVLEALRRHPVRIVVTCVQALMQQTLDPGQLASLSQLVNTGDSYDRDRFVESLIDTGYTFESEVIVKGTASVRGGIIDVWPVTESHPLRLDFFGAEIDSIRRFEPHTQRSIESIKFVQLPPVTEWDHLDSGRDSTLFHHLDGEATCLWSDSHNINEHAQLYEQTIAESTAGAATIGFAALRAIVAGRRLLRDVMTGEIDERHGDVLTSDFVGLRDAFSLPGDMLDPDAMETARRDFVEELAAHTKKEIHVFYASTASRDRYESTLFANRKVKPHVAVGPLSAGFYSEALKLIIIAEADLMGGHKGGHERYAPQPGRQSDVIGSRIDEATQLEPGDHVVHVEHGIGRYLGMQTITLRDIEQEVLAIEYDEGAKLYIPTSHVHLLSKYLGAGKRMVRLHRLGGGRWNREKAAAEKAIQDMAAQLLETQAIRQTLSGFAFPPDHAWQHAFEAAFPYRATRDQNRSIGEVKQDMEDPRPMDRLIFGDAGYGKTEVAMRAAFKCVMAGKQVAVLVPTTVLAQQHLATFRERMAAYPVRIEGLSRFQTTSERTEIIADLKEGLVDIVVGTHALLQPGLRFSDLGLLIIDEEQRFGVSHKETLKQLRRMVDVLTMTATPIPRTMYMGLTGAREMSSIQTPPKDRHGVETVVTPDTDALVRDAVMREINREGQIFYLYNRVVTIERIQRRLARIVPEARVAIAHGQMPSSELALVMRCFVAREFDVLLCTTIIESGVDIPNANTIIIDRADRFGLADLYQLRGRVGRSQRKGYAFLMLPPHGRVDPTARKRIGAIKSHSRPGAGFRLALRDLEIRGAGSLLGSAQSGHIAAVGFSLYNQLLRRTIMQMKGLPMPPVIDIEFKLDFLSFSPDAGNEDARAAIPFAYIEDEPIRLEAYRKLAEIGDLASADTLLAEFQDRFGAPPPTVMRLLQLARLRVHAHEQRLRSVETRDGKLMLRRDEGYVMRGARHPRLRAGTADTALSEIIGIIAELS